MYIHTFRENMPGEVTPPKDRTTSAVRKKMSAPALKSFFQIAKKWQVTEKQTEGLLGWPCRQTVYNWQKNTSTTLPYDTLTRISLILGIYKDLHILYPEKTFANNWVHMNNSNFLFKGKTPMNFMIEGGIDAMYSVRRLLDSRRGGWN